MENSCSTIKNERKLGAFEKRIHEIDFARGILIGLVIMDHLFNMLMTFGNQWCGGPGIFAGGFFDWYWYGNGLGAWATPRTYVYPIALAGFCCVSGISCVFSKNNWKRTIETLFVAAILFLGSNLIQVISNANGWGLQVAIDFNIIGVLGASMLVYCFLQNKPNYALLIAIGVGLLFTVAVPLIENAIIDLNDPTTYFIENRMGRDIIAPRFYCPLLWLPHKYGDGIKSGDWMPLFPYFCFFFVGVLMGRLLYKNKKSLVKRHEFERPICFIGRHTLIIYLTHIPVFYGVFMLIDLIVKAFIGG